MRIVIDLQGAQSTGSRNRGIGRYTNALALAMAQSPRGHEIVLALNGQFDESIEDVMDKFDGLIAPGNFRVWHPPSYHDLASAPARRANEKLYEAFLASLAPDVVHVMSLFEGLYDAAVTSVGAFAALPTAVALYDLIPLINARPYLDDPKVRDWYMRKVGALRRADMWFAISESSRQEGIRHLGLDPERCINVSTAADAQFRMTAVPPEREQALRARHGLDKPFVMYTGGIDLRKNIEGLIQAFALLPAPLQARFQLAVVCSARPEDKKRLIDLARKAGVPDGGLVVTGFVPDDELVDLYNLCHLFVFPSWHEGFGLPALEAMHCGAAVIGANTSSVPEVIGRADALFDPRDVNAIAAKMAQGLGDENFRNELRAYGRQQAKTFDWAESARRALDGLERLHHAGGRAAAVPRSAGVRPRLAYVSPLPPERTGIATYSAELLPYLARHYDIELITDLTEVDDLLLEATMPRRPVSWFRENAAAYDRVLYHFGNSVFHAHMFDLLAEIPGTVVLHDLYLSGVQAHLETRLGQAGAWTRALYASHGYPAIAERLLAQSLAETVLKYPASFEVLAQAQGVIVHSPHSIELARQWFGPRASQDWAVIPLLRALKAVDPQARRQRREAMGFSPDDFVVCSFGILDSSKLSHRLLDAWLASPLAASARCHLVFVGQNAEGDYGARLLQRSQSAPGGNISITGWASTETFHHYLLAADAAVQLRSQSRGETSAAVLDTMSYGVPTIVNANGSMAFLPQDAVQMLPDEFSDAQLVDALERLWREATARDELATGARRAIQANHAPAECARRYADAIEGFAARAALGRDGLVEAIGAEHRATPPKLRGEHLASLAQAIASSLPLVAPQAQLLLDVSALRLQPAGSGAGPGATDLVRKLLAKAPEGFRVEPVYAVPDEPGYRYARRWTLKLLDCPGDALEDLPIDARSGDVFVALDVVPASALEQRSFLRKLRHAGVRVEFVMHELDIESFRRTLFTAAG